MKNRIFSEKKKKVIHGGRVKLGIFKVVGYLAICLFIHVYFIYKRRKSFKNNNLIKLFSSIIKKITLPKFIVQYLTLFLFLYQLTFCINF